VIPERVIFVSRGITVSVHTLHIFTYTLYIQMFCNGTNRVTLRGMNNVKIKSVILHYVLDPLIQPAVCFPHTTNSLQTVQGRFLTSLCRFLPVSSRTNLYPINRQPACAKCRREVRDGSHLIEYGHCTTTVFVKVC
jgi:hypothetical protein